MSEMSGPQPPARSEEALSEPVAVTLARRVLYEHYMEPVMPVSEYCASLRLWMGAIQAKWAEGDTYPSDTGQGFHAVLGLIDLAIRKSSLLNRLIYIGEEFRTEKCPVHKGRWSGLPSGHEPCGCDLTGWLPASPALSVAKPADQKA